MADRRQVGLVLTGGGAFGAWATGALLAFFDWWRRHRQEEPPVVAAAGTSTGALIAPFTLLGKTTTRDHVAEVAQLYTTVTNDDICAPFVVGGALLDFYVYIATHPSVYTGGYDPDPGGASLLYAAIIKALPDSYIAALQASWPDRRLAVTTTNFAAGMEHVFSNAGTSAKQLREGILASAMAPLALPPVPASNIADQAEPHFDGGVCSEAPLKALFDIVNAPPATNLTHLVVISCFPWHPTKDDKDYLVQGGSILEPKLFPRSPNFIQTGNRMNALLSESAATKDTRLAMAAIELGKAGLDVTKVKAITGYDVRTTPTLIKLFPQGRLGWRAFKFDRNEMKTMQDRGRNEATATLNALGAP
jgi:predicted acylesterase/phospholipase RssA